MLQVPGGNENGRRVVDLCFKRWFCVGNISSSNIYISTLEWLKVMMEWKL